MKAVNLIPSDQRGGASRGAGRSQGGSYAVLALLAGLALLAAVYGIARHQVSSRTAKAVSLEAHVQQVQAEAAKLAPYTSFVALREARESAVTQLVNSRFDWAHAFHELGRVLPPHVAITSLTGAVGSASGPGGAATPAAAAPASSAASGTSTTGSTSTSTSVTSATPPGSVPTFTLSGCAQSQSTVALTLDRLRLMDGVSAVTLQSSTKATSSGGSAGAGGTTCPSSYPIFNVTVAFAALPASKATSSPAVSSPASSTTAANSTGGH
jgi:Tfp pilus assembly protein PilN